MTHRLRSLLVALALTVCVCSALAQDAKHETQLRTVRGVVVDKSTEAPVPSAVVFLRNTRTNAVRSYIADKEGNYRFSALDPNVDYEIHSANGASKSATRTVSSFNNNKSIF